MNHPERPNNFDFAIEMPYGGFLHSGGAGEDFTIDSIDMIYMQFARSRRSERRQSDYDGYDFNAQFFCIVCETPWSNGMPGAPVVPQ